MLKNKKLLIIIKNHDKRYSNYHNEVYEKIEQINRNYLSQKKEIDFVYVKANPNMEINHYLDEKNNNFWIKAYENNWECLKIKILESIKYFIYMSDIKYDYVFITNLSTFINVDKLLSECNSLDNNLCASVIGNYSFNGLSYLFPSGAGALYSSELLKTIFDYQYTVNHVLYPNTDDIFFGKLLHELNISIKPINRLNITSNNDYEIIVNDIQQIKNSSHIRIKIDNNRDMEPKYHELLADLIYGINK